MISVINILSIFNLAALAFLLVVRKQNSKANRVLGCSLLFSASDFVVNFLSYRGLLDAVPYLLFFNFSFLWAPFVLWYVVLMLHVRWKFSYKHLIHFIPQALSIIYWAYVFSKGDTYLNDLLKNREAGIYTWQSETFQITIMLQAIIYLGYSARLIYKTPGKSNPVISRVRLRWMKQFILVLSGLIFLLIMSTFLVQPVTIDYIVAPILYDISNVFLVYKSLSSSGIFTGDATDWNNEVVPAKERYTGSTVKPEQINEYKSKLMSHLREQEPFTDPELTLNDLADQTDMQLHHLSQVINQEFNKNFYDLINSYRIDKSKALMQDARTVNLTLEAIGLKSGFGSASSFYRSFKKQTGITPKAFLKTQNTPDL